MLTYGVHETGFQPAIRHNYPSVCEFHEIIKSYKGTTEKDPQTSGVLFLIKTFKCVDASLRYQIHRVFLLNCLQF